jgi:alpha/beta superfamily hydrolase
MPYTRTLLIEVPGSAHVLETRIALLNEGAAHALIAPPHPSYGGSIDNPVVEALEQAFWAHGLSTLALNFRGVGASGGEQRGDLDEAGQDFLAVARAPEAQPLRALAGYSFGAAVALRAASVLAIDHLILIAPAVGLFEPALLRDYARRLTIIVGREDTYAPHAALRALMPGAAHAQLNVLAGVDHFFSGAGLARLRAALPALFG